MSQPPDFDELVGGEGTPEEVERLRRVHELLVAVGPPAELSPETVEAPPVGIREPFRLRPRRRLEAVLAFAAVLLVTAFAVGYLVGGREDGFSAVRVVPMHGVGEAVGARASIAVGAEEGDGNWPLRLKVRGLRPLPAGSWYELYLLKDGRLRESCGTFNVGPKETTEIHLNAPYPLRRYDGWAVTRHTPGSDPGPVLLTT